MKSIRVRRCRWVSAQVFDDGRDGVLFIAEAEKNIPFAIKRVYTIQNLQNANALRGMHAHKKLKQVLFCVTGSCRVELFDGKDRAELILSDPHKGVYVGPHVWLIMRSFSRDCVLAVFASDHYKESDYIRDFRKFRAR